MKVRGAVLYGPHQDWSVEELELDPPRATEVRVRMVAAGICHSDEHFVTGDMVLPDDVREALGVESLFPMLGGHEGAGVVEEVGNAVTSLAVGDHVAVSFIPSCGRCRYCVSGRSYICDLGALLMRRGSIADGRSRHHVKGEDPTVMTQVGAFCEQTVVAEASLVKVDDDVPLVAAALVSCGVATGWGSAVRRAGTAPGDTVVVVGVGGVGMNAVQGAAAAGAQRVVAVDPVEWKLERAREFGATHVALSTGDAIKVVNELTRGQMADRVILTPGVLYGDLLAAGLDLTGKGGTCVATALAPVMQNDVQLNLSVFTLWNKEVKGTVFGSLNPRENVPALLALYREGKLKLDELVTRTYDLDHINDGFRDLREGRNIRGVITFD